MKRCISLFLLDNHKVFLKSFEAYIQKQRNYLWKGSGIIDIKHITAALQLKPDVILIDYHLSVDTGIEAIRRIRSNQFSGLVIILTTNHDQHVSQVAKLNGANGVVSKEANGHDLLAGINKLFFREISFLDIPEDRGINLKNSFQLTKQELNIANLVCTGLSSSQISNKLKISVHTVNTHRRKILSKTQSENFVQVSLKLKNL